MGTGRKKTGWIVAWGAGVLMLSAVQVVCAQKPAANGPAAQIPLSLPGVASAQNLVQEKILREIDDTRNGNRWLLVRDDAHPGGPARLVLVAASGREPDDGPRSSAAETEKAQIVIRAGDRLIVEEHTVQIDAAFEARALASAAAGAALDVRLTLGGKVVRVVALGPGRAAFHEETGRRP
jgi:hypothetical protein